MQFQESLTESFPFIRQILADACHIDACLFIPPYQDLDKIDRGFRRMIWKMDYVSSPLNQAMEHINGYRLFVIQSSLDFYNVIAFVSHSTPASFISLGPFRDREMTESDLARLLQSHRLPTGYIPTIRQFYYSLPIVELQHLIPMLRHLLAAFLPQYQDIEPEYINYSENHHAFLPNDETIRHFSYDEAETYALLLNRFLDALITGNSEEASSALRSFLDCQGYHKGSDINQMKKILFAVNTYCCGRMLGTQIQPGFILERYVSCDLQIQNLTSPRSLLHLPYEIARKYCLLIKNYSFSEYSYLIRNVMNYITLHLSEDLSLSVIAAFFQKNPSYLSGQFCKETGENLTDYIQKERMQTAIRYFNTTNMSVAEVAGCVGIHDFGYFSRIFKKHIGQSPSQYRKMVKT